MPSDFHAPPKLNFLTGDDKKAWAKRAQKFIITGLRGPISNTYEGVTSERHLYTLCPLDSKSGELMEPVLLPMTLNDVRAQVAEAVGAQLAEDASGVGPCVLAWVTAKVPGGGVWSIEPA
jgi:hypothetical protein